MSRANELLKEFNETEKELKCDMESGCTSPISHIDNKGWIYCASHAKRRGGAGGTPCRALTQGEISQLKDGKAIPWKRKKAESYDRITELLLLPKGKQQVFIVGCDGDKSVGWNPEEFSVSFMMGDTDFSSDDVEAVKAMLKTFGGNYYDHNDVWVETLEDAKKMDRDQD